MGIPGLYGNWLTRQVKQAIFNGLPPKVASLSFDLNGVFHEARQLVFIQSDDPRVLQAIANTNPLQLELQIQNAIASIILNMIKAAQPRDCLILAVDGVAPGAKMQQQRGRREKSAKEKSPGETFDRNAITPGTEFMMNLDNFIVRFIGQYRQILPPKVIYSSHLVPGEGEHKIMDYYRNGEVSDGPVAQDGGAHILYGLDADLIMLSLESGLNNIYLARETVRESVNIDRVKDFLMDNGKRPSSIDDFIVMMFLIGNDFLPHMPSLEEMSESIQQLLDIYAQGNYVLTQETINGRREINWSNMKLFVQAIAERENELLAALSVKEVKYPSRFLQGALINGQFYPQVFRSKWYQNALGPKGSSNFTNTLAQIVGRPISEITPQRIQDMAVAYMRTMAWTYLYYREGTSAIDQDWLYPYYHTPLLGDLAAVMGVTENITGYEAYDGMITFTALHQLVAVLPVGSKDLLPLELQPLMAYNSIIRDLYPDKFIIEMDGKNKDHEGIPIIPLIDRRRIYDAVAQIPFTPERVKLWMPATDQIFTRTQAEAEIMAILEFDRKRHEEYLARQAAQLEKRRAYNEQRFPRQQRSPQQTQQRFPQQTQQRFPQQTQQRFPQQTQQRFPQQTQQRFPQQTQQTQQRSPQQTQQRFPQQTRGQQTEIRRPPRQQTRQGQQGFIQRLPTKQTVTPVQQTIPTITPIQRPVQQTIPTQQSVQMIGGAAPTRQIIQTRQQIPVIPITQQGTVPIQRNPTSPAQWQQQPKLM